MFTGLVAAVGRIVDVQPLPGGQEAGVRLKIDASGLDLGNVGLGDSIAIQGACMTVISLPTPGQFEVDVSQESLRRTVGLNRAGEVNLEKSLCVGEQIGGHLVSGHVDGLGEIVSFDAVGESRELVVRIPKALARYLAYKGSVTVNGISLTVNRVHDDENGCEISINIIPHTQQVTTLRNVGAGDKVNIEIDTIARYVERMLSLQR